MFIPKVLFGNDPITRFSCERILDRVARSSWSEALEPFEFIDSQINAAPFLLDDQCGQASKTDRLWRLNILLEELATVANDLVNRQCLHQARKMMYEGCDYPWFTMASLYPPFMLEGFLYSNEAEGFRALYRGIFLKQLYWFDTLYPFRTRFVYARDPEGDVDYYASEYSYGKIPPYLIRAVLKSAETASLFEEKGDIVEQLTTEMNLKEVLASMVGVMIPKDLDSFPKFEEL